MVTGLTSISFACSNQKYVFYHLEVASALRVRNCKCSKRQKYGGLKLVSSVGTEILGE